MTPQPDWLSSLPGAVRGWPLALLRAGDLADLAYLGGAARLQQDQAGERQEQRRQPLGENKAFILKLAQIHPLRVRVTLPAAPYGRIKPGSRAEVMPKKPADGRHAATGTGIDKLVDAASGTFRCGWRWPTPAARCRPG